MFEFVNAGDLVALFCGLAALFAVFAALGGGPKGLATFVLLLMLAQFLPEGSGLLLLIIVAGLTFLVNDTTIVISSGSRGTKSKATRDYSINYGAVIFGIYCLINWAVGSFIFWQLLQQTPTPWF